MNMQNHRLINPRRSLSSKQQLQTIVVDNLSKFKLKSETKETKFNKLMDPFLKLESFIDARKLHQPKSVKSSFHQSQFSQPNPTRVPKSVDLITEEEGFYDKVDQLLENIERGQSKDLVIEDNNQGQYFGASRRVQELQLNHNNKLQNHKEFINKAQSQRLLCQPINETQSQIFTTRSLGKTRATKTLVLPQLSKQQPQSLHSYRTDMPSSTNITTSMNNIIIQQQQPKKQLGIDYHKFEKFLTEVEDIGKTFTLETRSMVKKTTQIIQENRQDKRESIMSKGLNNLRIHRRS